MVIDKFTFFRNETTARNSNVYVNVTKGSLLTLEVQGTASGFELIVEGTVEDKGDYDTVQFTTLGVIDNTAFNLAQSITQEGIFGIGIEGCIGVRVRIVSVNGGNLTVFGKISA